MTTVRTILKTTPLANGKRTVLICVCDHRRREYFKTGFSAKEGEFDSSRNAGRFLQGRGIPVFKVQREEEDGSVNTYTNKEANDVLAKLEGRVYDIIARYNADHISWGFEQLRADYTNAPKRNLFLAFSQSVIESEYLAQDRFKRAQIATEALESLKKYDKNLPKKVFQDITPQYIQGYVKYCKDQGNSSNTIGMRLRELRCFYNIGIREKVVSSELYPFSSGREDGKVRIPKIEQNKTDQYLPLESMGVLAAAKFEDPILDRTRHLYLFSYHCRGMNWRDMALLTKDNIYKKTERNAKGRPVQVTMIQYKRSKTKGAFDIQVTSPIQNELDWFKENTALLGDYLLPIISVEQSPEKLDGYLHQIRMRCNKSLQAIAKALNLPESQQKITFYSARHSFAMTMRDIGRPIDFISQALGHQSEETTKHYLAKFDSSWMAKGTFIDLSKPLKGKKTKVIKVQKPRKTKARTSKASKK